MRGVFLSVFVLVVFLVVFSSNALAQENEVCIVYFTGDYCGDDCRLTDSFMGGIMNEYHEVLTMIEYNIDSSPLNEDVFEAYRSNYGLPYGLPLVLFGKNDYLLGMDDIYEDVESKIYSFINANGTNCPLESGYVPPSGLNSGDLSGNPEVFGMVEGEKNGEDSGEGNEGEVTPDEKETEDKGSEIPFVVLVIEDEEGNAYPISLLSIAAVIILMLLIAALITMRKRIFHKT